MELLLNFFNPKHYGKTSEAEIPPYIKDFLRIPLGLFVISFSIGTILLLSYLITHLESLMVLGLFYVLAATIINLIVLAFALIIAIASYQHALLILQKTLVMLLNIPITMLYIHLITL